MLVALARCYRADAVLSSGMTNPIQTLVEDRRKELGLRKQDVVHRAGFKNLSKGCRRYDELLAGELHTARGLINRLPAALELPAETVTEAVDQTRQEFWEAEDGAYRAAFEPHAILITEHRIPTQITFAAITGADRRLWVNFEPGSSRITYIQQALKAVKLRSPIRFCGAVVGLIVNYSPDQAVRFDLQGNAVEVLPAAYRLGQLTFAIRGKPVRPEALAAILGIERSAY